MKKFFILFLLCAVTFVSRAESSQWLTNFGAAKKQARQEDKKILLLFTGSDWCPWCQKWEKEALSKPEFLSYAKTNLVLLVVDFPEKKPLPKIQAKANEVLRQEYNAEEFPLAVVTDAKGKKLAAFKYLEGGPKVVIDKLETVRSEATAQKK